jgi:hypothetical protein
MADMDGWENIIELFMKVTLILEGLSPDRELTRIMVGSRWIYPRFQVSFIPHLVSALS